MLLQQMSESDAACASKPQVPWQRFCEIVRSRRRFVLTSHVRPDCDALGSELAMAAILEGLGKEVLICERLCRAAEFEVHRSDEAHASRSASTCSRPSSQDYDVLMVLDTSAWAQLGAMGEVIRGFGGVKMVLDHHVSDDDLGAELFKDTTAEATGRLVIDAADQLGVPLTPQIARPAFVAIATDTGWFRFASTRPGTLRLAARLVEAGAKPDEIYTRTLRERHARPAAADRPHARPRCRRNSTAG